MTGPPADVRITTATIRGLLRQAPAYADLPVQYAGHGWDNEMWRLGAALALRLPRRREAAPLMRNELTWLARMAARLAVGAPVPVLGGRPSGDYPYPWAVVPWLEGAPTATMQPVRRDAYAGELADALRSLHAPAPAEAPVNPYRGVDFAERAAQAVIQLGGAAPPVLLGLIRDASEAPVYRGRAVWLHGDPHPGNVLVRDGRLHALIDFGDLCRGDPASDLGVAWLHFTRGGREQFFSRYGADPALRRRARGWAVYLATAIAARVGQGPLGACAEHALGQLLEDAAGAPGRNA